MSDHLPEAVPERLEFYALGHDRSAAVVRRFLDHYLRDRKSSRDEFPVPELSENPGLVLASDGEVLEYMERHPDESYGLYWDRRSDRRRDEAEMAMVFYQRDGGVVFGIVVWATDPEKTLADLARYVGAKYCMIESCARPPDTAREFIALCPSGPRAWWRRLRAFWS